MSNNRKYYRTTFTFSILSEEPIPEGAELIGVLDEADAGEYVADTSADSSVQEELTGKEMADALYAAGSQPEFFDLNDDGIYGGEGT